METGRDAPPSVALCGADWIPAYAGMTVMGTTAWGGSDGEMGGKAAAG